MANELWYRAIIHIVVMGVYWPLWHQRIPSAKKGYLLISFIGFLMGFVIFAGSLLPVAVAPLVIVPSIRGCA
jgi:hypothetical protein